MPSSLENRHRIRRSFGSLSAPIKVPHLLKVQLDSFERFLQREVPPDQREDKGLEAVFRSVFPVSDFSGSSTLEFVHYRLGDPKYVPRNLPPENFGLGSNFHWRKTEVAVLRNHPE